MVDLLRFQTKPFNDKLMIVFGIKLNISVVKKTSFITTYHHIRQELIFRGKPQLSILTRSVFIKLHGRGLLNVSTCIFRAEQRDWKKSN